MVHRPAELAEGSIQAVLVGVVPSRRSRVTGEIRFSRMEIAVRSRSVQWVSIGRQSIASSPNSESM
ncbi:hypothetical protein B0I32_13929 [Nonomuraea fuscirosea]|uniref:Uncharacterized protein n=1 Tax=Nonomuraea fuscirosea TaxID=1291556 RepID=A0A2T0LXT8_9ACTN|nr:hypothetical protein B0I32_13929 [Nonomuraea fuscirosea]